MTLAGFLWLAVLVIFTSGGAIAATMALIRWRFGRVPPMDDLVPFPRTVPDPVPLPPKPLLDQRAARAFFEDKARTDMVISYRLTDDGVAMDDGKGERFYPWAEVRAFVDRLYARSTSEDPDDPGRRRRFGRRR